MDDVVKFMLPLLVANFMIAISGSSGRPEELVKKHHIDDCLNISREYYDTSRGYICCSCHIGEHLIEDCKQNNPKTTKCERCIYNGQTQTFTSEANNYRSCNTSKPSTTCKKLMYTKFKAGNYTVDNKCVCVDGTYARDPEISGCKNFTKCAPNFEVKTFGDSNHDLVCGPCPDGRCSYEYSSTEKCIQCNKNISSGYTGATPTTANDARTGSIDTERTVLIIVVVALLVAVSVLIFRCWHWKKLAKLNLSKQNDSNGNGDSSVRYQRSPQNGANGDLHLEGNTDGPGSTHTPQESNPDVTVTANIVYEAQQPLLEAADSPPSSHGQSTTSGHVYQEVTPENTDGLHPEEPQDEPSAETVEGQPDEESQAEPIHDENPDGDDDQGTESSQQSVSDVPSESMNLRKELAIPFKYESHIDELMKMDVEQVQIALLSEECLKFMFEHLVHECNYQNFLDFIRQMHVLTEVEIDDAAKKDGEKEKRRGLYKVLCYKQGKKLNPKILLRDSKEYGMQKVYDDLCTAFKNYLRRDHA